MTRKELETIKYFILKKDLFHHKAGDQVGVCLADGRNHLFVGDISIPIEYASNSEWLEPVSISQYKVIFENNCIKYFMEEKGLTLEAAKKVFNSMFDK